MEKYGSNVLMYGIKRMWVQGSVTMPVTKKSASITPEVNMTNPLHAGGKHAHERNQHYFETQGRHHQKSKTGVPVAPRKGLFFKKKVKATQGLASDVSPD